VSDVHLEIINIINSNIRSDNDKQFMERLLLLNPVAFLTKEIQEEVSDLIYTFGDKQYSNLDFISRVSAELLTCRTHDCKGYIVEFVTWYIDTLVIIEKIKDTVLFTNRTVEVSLSTFHISLIYYIVIMYKDKPKKERNT